MLRNNWKNKYSYTDRTFKKLGALKKLDVAYLELILAALQCDRFRFLEVNKIKSRIINPITQIFNVSENKRISTSLSC